MEVTELLRDAGYDAMSVLDQDMGGESDPVLDEVCIKEGRILVTLDTDFADIRVYPPSKAPGYFVLRLKHQDKFSVIEIVQRLILVFKQESLENRLWIGMSKSTHSRMTSGFIVKRETENGVLSAPFFVDITHGFASHNRKHVVSCFPTKIY